MRILLDTDPAMGSLGGDPEDCFALLLALASPELTLDAVTVVQGNVPVDHGYANAVHLLELAGRPDVPVYAGADAPLSTERTDQRAWLASRSRLERLAPAATPPGGQPHAAVLLARHVMDHPGQVTVVSIGPLTNLALALRHEPELVACLPHVVMMAGAATVPGNVTPAAEFNVWMDPEAAAQVFESGIPITMVGLDVCEKTHLREEHLAALESSGGELGRFVARATRPFLELRRQVFGAEDLHLYDSLAVAAALRPSLLTTTPAWVAVETEGTHTAGETVAWTNPVLRKAVARREPNAEVAIDVDAAAFEALFAERVLGASRGRARNDG